MVRYGTRGLAGVVATLVAVIVLVGSETRAEDAGEGEPSGAHSIEVDFRQLDVVRTRGRLAVDYEIAPRSRQTLGDRRLAAWVRLHIPTGGPGAYPHYTYTEPLEDSSGRVVFPEWLSTFGAEEVGVCPLATGPGDHLGLGTGWVCERPVWRRVHTRGTAPPTDGVTIRLWYRSVPTYPTPDSWPEGAAPELPSPMEPVE